MKKLLTGNEAVAEGIIETGVEVFCGYPRTPSTEVILNLLYQEKDLGIHIEWSVNEKIAFEIAEKIGASFFRLNTDISHVTSDVEVGKNLNIKKKLILNVISQNILKQVQPNL